MSPSSAPAGRSSATARARAVAFDFNGTLSDDEPLLCAIYCALFAELGRPLSPQEYFGRFAGHSDRAIVSAWLGEDFDGLDAFVAARVARYSAAAADGSTIAPHVRAAVRLAARHLPVVVVSAAFRSEIELALEASGLAPLLSGIVAADDVVRTKPDPSCYRRMLALVGLDDPAAAIAFEDTEPGLAAARAAGLRTVAVGATPGAAQLSADAEVERIDPASVARLLGLPPA